MNEPSWAQHGAARRRRDRALERGFRWLCASALLLPIALLGVLLIDVAVAGFARLDLAFLSGVASADPTTAGLWPAVVGSVVLVSLTGMIALPIGVGAAIYLEEYGDPRSIAGLIEINIANLAGVPSVIYGLLGLELFARALALGYSLIAGALTMALLILPMVILAARAALRGVPRSLREAGIALGGTRWQVIRQVVLPSAWPGILAGAILAVSRALGEAAVVLVLGALAFASFVPDGLGAPFTVLPVLIFTWVSAPGQAFVGNAAAGIVVLLLVLLLLNGLAIVSRDRAARRGGWQ